MSEYGTMGNVPLLLFLCVAAAEARCPGGYSAWFDGRCFAALETAMTEDFQRATELAGYQKAHLAIIHSEQENEWIRSVSSTSGHLPMIFGLQCHEATGKFVWSDGSALDYANFASDPGDCNDAKFVLFNRKTGKWETTVRIGSSPLLVEYNFDDEFPCDVDFEYIPESRMCVKAVETPAIWVVAEADCHSMGKDIRAHLLSIHDYESNERMRRYASNLNFNRGIHIGMQQTEIGGHLVWSDESDLDYSAFEDANLGSNDGACFAAFEQSIWRDRWFRVQCGGEEAAALPYICAIPVSTVKPTISADKETNICVQDRYFIGEGDVYSPAYPHALQANTTCEFFIAASENNELVELSIRDLDLNACCDKLDIYEGALGNQLITTLTGSKSKEDGLVIRTKTNKVMRLVLSVGDGRRIRGMHLAFKGH